MSQKQNSVQFGLLGKSLKHSFSELYFKNKFQELGLDAEYRNYEIQTIGEFVALKSLPNLVGLNVTIPYKEEIILLLDELSEEAERIGAVNTILIEDGKTTGYNTDAFGFKQMIKPFLLNTHERALVLGNGGAAKAVKFVLEQIGLSVLVVARNPKTDEFSLTEINDMMVKHCGIIVNTTPVGMFPNLEDCLDFPFDALNAGHLVVDLIYNPEETNFLSEAKTRGATTLNGLTMLHQQAEKSWEIWRRMV